MTKPSPHALKAAREIIERFDVLEEEFISAPEKIASRIDAAADAIVHEKLAALRKLEVEWRAYATKVEEADGGDPRGELLGIIGQYRRCADVLRDALDKLERGE